MWAFDPFLALVLTIFAISDTGGIILVGVGSAVIGLVGVVYSARATRQSSDAKDSTDRIRLAQEVLTETIDRQDTELETLRRRDKDRESEISTLRQRDTERETEMKVLHQEIQELRALINRYRQMVGDI